jgi:predicted nucleotidyltransferase
MPYGLTRETVAKIKGVFSSFSEIEEAILYGSRAKGNYQPGSDIDLTLKGRELKLIILNKISLDLDDLLLPYSCDISIFHQISNPDLIEHIERVGLVFYKKEGD